MGEAPFTNMAITNMANPGRLIMDTQTNGSLGSSGSMGTGGPPKGHVKLTPGAAARNLKGDITNGTEGRDWGTFGGSDTWASPEVAARLEAAAAPVAPPAPSVAPPPAPTAPPAPSMGTGAGGGGGGTAMAALSGLAPEVPQSLPMAMPPSGGMPLNPMLGRRLPPSQLPGVAALGRLAY